MTIRHSLPRLLRATSAGMTWSVGLTALALLVAFTAPAFAAPVLDGTIQDVIDQANTYISNGTGCGIVTKDPAKDVCLTEPLIVPCTTNLTTCSTNGQYYVNGFDQILVVAAVQGTDAWWGIRVIGQIGDSDGDGTDGETGNCPPPGLGTIPLDAPGIGEGEHYIFRLDTNCDAVTDFRITVQGGDRTHKPTVFITQADGVTPVPGASGLAQYGTTDLEIHTTGLVLPPVFSMNTFVSSTFSGMSEDAAETRPCNAPMVSLAIQGAASNPGICPGTTDRFTLSVTNTTSAGITSNLRDILPTGWTYLDKVSGDWTFANQNGQLVAFGPLTIQSGATRTVTFDATSPSHCEGPYVNKAVADGVLDSPCVTAAVSVLTDTSTTDVACLSETAPCASIFCAPADTTVQIGDSYSVRATATNCSTGTADISVTVNGQTFMFPGIASGASVTAVVGPFSGETGGTSIYDASATATNNCGTSNPAVTCRAKVTCEGGLCCWLTMRGFLNGSFNSGNKENTFGGNVGPSPSGSWQHIQRNGKTEVFNFHSHDAHVIACSNDGTAGPCHPDGDANVIEFGGTGFYSLNGGSREFAATFTARAEDHGEPGNQPQHSGGCGTPDYYTITVKDASTGEVVFTAGALLDGGNIQIHDCKHATKTSAPNRGGPGPSTNGSGDPTSTGVELYRPTPNPFPNTTSFTYETGQLVPFCIPKGTFPYPAVPLRERSTLMRILLLRCATIASC
ncbi:MAG TPA: hypothetical protein VFD98_03130 [Terracidiphilus sp.]|nr:hypothetical protein [Terracidiphilus sp.]